jgi:AcrR family transcriptional regulator
MTTSVGSGVTSGARARVRAEITAEIKAVARRHLAEQGSAALSLRAVAREVGMVSSAVYRYFPSRDDLLTALIIDAYHAVGEAAETADATRRRRDLAGRWLAVCRAVRAWARSNPQEYALIYGSPVPGYRAPTDTIGPASRVSLVMLAILIDGCAHGALEPSDGAPASHLAHAVGADLAALRDVAAPGVPDAVLMRGMLVWTQLFGLLSFELFGHLHGVIHDYDGFFDAQIRRSAQVLISGS